MCLIDYQQIPFPCYRLLRTRLVFDQKLKATDDQLFAMKGITDLSRILILGIVHRVTTFFVKYAEHQVKST